MTIAVGYRYVAGSIVVGYWDGGAGPVITSATTVQDGATFTITGSGFSSSGNTVLLGQYDTEGELLSSVPVATESATSIVTAAVEASNRYLTQPNLLLVESALGILSNALEITITPATGQKAAAVGQDFLGDASTRLSASPELEIGDELRIRAVLGTNVTVADVHISAQGAVDVTAEVDADPQVNSFEYAVFDGESLSGWASVTFAALAVTAVVPSVQGLLLADAQAAIGALGLVPAVVASVPSSTLAAGRVLLQFPGATSVVAAGSVVELTISLGLTQALVPRLIGLTVPEAVDRLESAGLTVGTVTYVAGGTGDPSVSNQTLAPGEVVALWAVIDLEIYIGDAGDVPVPDVDNFGTTEAEARRAILLAYLLTTALFVYSEAITEGYVISQDPAADALLGPGSTVTIRVSLGSQPVVRLTSRPSLTLREFLLGET